MTGELEATCKRGFSAFGLGCWLLGMVVLAQLWIAGMALAVRFNESQAVRIVEKEVVREVRVEVPVVAESGKPPVPAGIPPLRPLRPADPADAGTVAGPALQHPAVEPSPLKVPLVADPVTERLLLEGREARVSGDMGKAIVKFEQALKQSAGEPNALYELGLVHEQMGVFDRASEYYLQVFKLGLARAGVLFEMAKVKLRDGFEQPVDMLGKLSLGRVRIFKNRAHEAGERVILTIPVQKGPGAEVEVNEIEVEVRFFNRTGRGDIVELDDPTWAVSSWVSLPFDWAGGEESLRMTYTIPVMDPETEHLFGKRSYYGQVVTLSYEGEVMDVQAWPRDLAAKIVKTPEAGVGEWLPPEFLDTLDPSLPLLPPR